MSLIAQALQRDGYCVQPNFLSATEVRLSSRDLESSRAAGEFHRAGTGKGEALEVRDDIRRDDIHWLERDAANPARSALWAKLDELRLSLNREQFLGLRDFEGHYAVYPSGGFYRRHLDTFRGDPSRLVSLILYLNEGWEAADGGELRIYLKDGKHLDLPPVGGTLVCFLSQEFEHEVLPARRARASFTGWFKR
jgi:SM-20-related protein